MWPGPSICRQPPAPRPPPHRSRHPAPRASPRLGLGVLPISLSTSLSAQDLDRHPLLRASPGRAPPSRLPVRPSLCPPSSWPPQAAPSFALMPIPRTLPLLPLWLLTSARKQAAASHPVNGREAHPCSLSALLTGSQHPHPTASPHRAGVATQVPALPPSHTPHPGQMPRGASPAVPLLAWVADPAHLDFFGNFGVLLLSPFPYLGEFHTLARLSLLTHDLRALDV